MREQQEHSFLDDDSSGYLISVSDMMSGLLIIFIITLVAFIINYHDAVSRQEQARQLQEKIVTRLTNANQLRAQLLRDLKRALSEQDIQIVVDEQHGVLRLTEQSIRFDTGSASLVPIYLERLGRIRAVLESVLPCYGRSPPTEWLDSGHCTPETQAELEAVFIEGHTDNVPVGRSNGRVGDNWDLSAQRAIYTYRNLVIGSPLATIQNTTGQPVFSVSGYGEGRPVPGHEHLVPTPDESNRRIDLRFIMTPPSVPDAVKQLKDQGIR